MGRVFVTGRGVATSGDTTKGQGSAGHCCTCNGIAGGPRDTPTTRGAGTHGGTGGGRRNVGITFLNNVGRVNGGVAICRCNSSVFVISYKLTFPNARLLNISSIVPSFACVTRGVSGMEKLVIARNRRSRVNNVPCLLGGFGVPVCSAELAVNLVGKGLGRRNLLGGTGLRRVGPSSVIGLNGFSIRFVRIGRSVPSTINLTVASPINIVVRANSFGVSAAPISNSVVGVPHFTRCNAGNMLTLFRSSAGTRQPNCAVDRGGINRSFLGLFAGTNGHEVIITAFTSGVREIRRVVSITGRLEHGITIINEDLRGLIRINRRLKCLGIPSGVLVDVSGVGSCPSSGLIVVAANSRNRPVDTLAGVTGNRREGIATSPGSCIVVSTAPVPNGRGVIDGIIGRLVGHSVRIVCRGVCRIRISKRTYRRRLGLVVNIVGPGFFFPIRNRRGRLGGRTGLTRTVNVSGGGVFVNSVKGRIRVARGKVGALSGIPDNSICISNVNINSIKGVILGSEGRLSTSNVVVVITAVSSRAKRILSNPSVMDENFICIHRDRRLVTSTESLSYQVVRRACGDDCRS